EMVRDLDAQVHAVGFVAPLILARPPDAGTLTLARGVDPVASVGILAERDAAEPSLLLRRSGVVHLHLVGPTGRERSGKVDVHGFPLSLERDWVPGVQDAIDGQVLEEIQLDTRVALERPDADSVKSRQAPS